MKKITKKKHLEMAIQKVPKHPNPKVDLEQYSTPATIAADLLWNAYSLGDIADKKVMDLGCGTGLELEEYFALNSSANITGIDLSEGMLSALKNKFPNKSLDLICGSYFDAHFGMNRFNAAVSVESLHHFAAERKRPLYKKLFYALKADGYFILTDYFAESEALERECFTNLRKLKKEQGIDGDKFYHYDMPLTVEHEVEALKAAGFLDVKILGNWGATYTLKAIK